MNALRYLWFFITILFYPLRLVIWMLHRFAVFFSKAGARWIIPLVMLSLGMLLRSQIDAFAGASITDFYEGFGEPVFSFRIEITFAILFLLLFFSLKIVAYVMSPIVGALPVPAKPLTPMRPLTVKKHEIKGFKAKLAVSAKRKGYFNGQLERLDRYLPPHIQAVLKTPAETEELPAPAATPSFRPASTRPDGQGAAPRPAPRPAAPTAALPPQQRRQPEDISHGHYEIPPHQSQRSQQPPPREAPRRPAPPAQPPMPPRIQRPAASKPQPYDPDAIDPPRLFGPPPGAASRPGPSQALEERPSNPDQER